ncbi:hypothetical protein [Acidovorax sp. sic0104]|uniref:hypothetical protein n=1 Tax=Acidovorax sp. sic0104 TaxID=2854784 RepID=UPI001C43ECF7|nr:hypothetical protein [Acidovorax sp. sic0104]MBV7540609.1 hypothetical protein [Acidovorax sp. sic0104]
MKIDVGSGEGLRDHAIGSRIVYPFERRLCVRQRIRHAGHPAGLNLRNVRFWPTTEVQPRAATNRLAINVRNVAGQGHSGFSRSRAPNW